MESSRGFELATVDLVVLGQRLRELRIRRGLTQAQLAADDISYAYVSRIEAGQRRPELAILANMARRLGSTVEYLLTGIEETTAHDVRVTLQFSELALHSGDAREAIRQLSPLWSDRAKLGPFTRELEWLWARCQEAVGQLSEAAEVLERLVSDQSFGYWLSAAVVLSRCYRTAGDLTRSIEIGERALSNAELLELAGTDDAIRLLVSLVGAYYERGDLLYARQLCRVALQRAEQAATPAARAAAYWNASIIASRSGQLDDAVRLAGKALMLLSEGDDQRNLGLLRHRYATLLLRGDPPDPAEGERQVRQAKESLLDGPGTTVDLAWCDLTLSEAQFAQQQPEAARQTVLRALEAAGSEAPFVTAEAQLLLGRIAWEAGEKGEALAHFRSAVESLTGAQADRQAASLWFELGQLLDDAGDTAGALDAFRSAAAASGVSVLRRGPTPVRLNSGSA